MKERNFTQRETEILHYLISGATNLEIAESLFLSPHTIKLHVSAILNKLNVSTRVQAAVKAIKLGFEKEQLNHVNSDGL